MENNQSTTPQEPNTNLNPTTPVGGVPEGELDVQPQAQPVVSSDSVSATSSVGGDAQVSTEVPDAGIPEAPIPTPSVEQSPTTSTSDPVTTPADDNVAVEPTSSGDSTSASTEGDAVQHQDAGGPTPGGSF